MERVMFKYLPEGACFEYDGLHDERHIAIRIPVTDTEDGYKNYYDITDNKLYYMNIFNKVLYNPLYFYVYEAYNAKWKVY